MEVPEENKQIYTHTHTQLIQKPTFMNTQNIFTFLISTVSPVILNIV